MDYKEDLYKVLGLGEDASRKDIRKAFRNLSKKYHPDKNIGDKAAEKEFKKISQAYDILKDEKKKNQYDHMRKYGFQGGTDQNFQDLFGDSFHRQYGSGGEEFTFHTGGSGGGLEDVFGQIFQSSKKRKQRIKGEDMRSEITIPFMTAAIGGSVDVTLQQPDNYTTRTLNIKIPSGVDDDEKIRLRGQGNPGIRGGANGDLIVSLHVEPHSFYRRKELDILVEMKINFGQAVFGSTVTVESIHNKRVNLKIKQGTQGGTVLRVPGMGIQKGSRRGDMLITLQVKIPKFLDAKQQQLVQELCEVFEW
ncbi:MAG: hypothetical protein B6244_04345 [Candidatus Cloacimonetes bacterium 4572_55]|nr:MAG: hypothetical protein B6244_04345 [Candidatus Cloacimonetes bacterium 4572_55]